MDLLKEMSSNIENQFNETFEYTLELTPDRRYGIIRNGSINGMLGQVFNGVSFNGVTVAILTFYFNKAS